MKRIKILTSALAAMFCVFAVSAQEHFEVQKKYNEAAEIINKDKNYAKAVVMFEEVVKQGTPMGVDVATEVGNAKKTIPQLYYQMGLDAAKAKKYPEAKANFKKAEARAKEYRDITWQKKAQDRLVNVYIVEGGALFNAKQYDKASEVYLKGLEDAPNNQTLMINLATSYVEGGKKNEGFAMYKQVIEQGKGNANATKAQAMMENYETKEASDALAAKNYAKGLSLIESILKDNPKNAAAHLMLIQTLNNQKKYDDVIRRGPAAAAAQGKPENKSEVFFLMGIAYDNKNDSAKAIENFRKVTAGNNVKTAKEQIDELSK